MPLHQILRFENSGLENQDQILILVYHNYILADSTYCLFSFGVQETVYGESKVRDYFSTFGIILAGTGKAVSCEGAIYV